MPIAEIDLNALRHNLDIVKKLAPSSKVMAVIKADAYGHGAITVAQALNDADAFAVARFDEALNLRKQGIKAAIVVLGGCDKEAQLQDAISKNIHIVVHQQNQLEQLIDLKNNTPQFWLKFDTGMGRLGFNVDEYDEILLKLTQTSKINSLLGVMTHLANADDVEDTYSLSQVEKFNTLATNKSRSMANSAGIMAWPQTHYEWVRPGLMLYGLSPNENDINLKPVMTFKAELISIQKHKKGDAIGYGGRWVCPENMPVGVVSVGYGDGYPREMSDGCPVLINGQTVPLVGQVSMDMLTVDLRTLADAKTGDEVTLWGKGLAAEVIAKHAGTIPYTLVCGITRRVDFKEIGMAKEL